MESNLRPFDRNSDAQPVLRHHIRNSHIITELKVHSHQDGGIRHFEKSKKSRYLGNGLTDRHNVWHDDEYWPSEPDKQLKFRTFKNLK